MGVEQGLSQAQLDFYESEGGVMAFFPAVGSGLSWSVLELNFAFGLGFRR